MVAPYWCDSAFTLKQLSRHTWQLVLVCLRGLLLSLLHQLYVMLHLLLDHVTHHLGVMGRLLGDGRHQVTKLRV